MTSTLAPQASSSTSSICLYTEQFASILASQVTSKLVLKPVNLPATNTTISSNNANNVVPYLSLWILSPSIHYSFSGGCESTPVTAQHAMKVFFQIPTPKEAEALVEKQDVEEVFLPTESIEEIREVLQMSSTRLPKSARKFGLWDAGLLERFSTDNV